jgi:hypothetical protein
MTFDLPVVGAALLMFKGEGAGSDSSALRRRFPNTVI